MIYNFDDMMFRPTKNEKYVLYYRAEPAQVLTNMITMNP